jgi:type VI secretion system protein ImpH
MEDMLIGAPVSVEQFVGRWVTIEERQLLRLGIANTTLAGRRHHRAPGVRPRGEVQAGARAPAPEGLPALSAGRRRPRADLRELVTFYVRDPLEFDVELILAPGETPSLRLSASPGEGSRLGSTPGSPSGPTARRG